MLLIDAITVKVRDAQVANRPVFVAIGVDLAGERDVLGLWLGPTGGEGAKQWATMLTELRKRGLADALIVCCDGLRGLPESIRATWPQATVQTCVVHLVRNSLRYASKKHWSQITKAMRQIYTAPTIEAAKARFEAFAADWEQTYAAMIRSWRQSWDEFTPFLEFPAELRRVVYTTNAVESLNARFRRAVQHRGHFPNEQAAMKVLYLVATTRRKNRQNLTGKTNGVSEELSLHKADSPAHTFGTVVGGEPRRVSRRVLAPGSARSAPAISRSVRRVVIAWVEPPRGSCRTGRCPGRFGLVVVWVAVVGWDVVAYGGGPEPLEFVV